MSPVIAAEGRGPGGRLAEFVTATGYDELPDAIRELTVTVAIDAIASAIAGRHGDELAAMESLVAEAFGPGEGSVLGSRERYAPAGAVLLNGYQTTAVALCDVFRPARCHLSPEVVPAALAVAEATGASGRDVIAAIAVGLEVTARVALAVNFPVFRARGWHPPGVAGPFGAAAAAGSLLGLDVAQLCDAFGIAGSQAAGSFAQWGSATIKFSQARGGMSGYLAAMLAARGFSGARDVFTDPDGGLLTTHSDGGLPEHLTTDLGADWALRDLSLRLWPAASPVQTVVTSVHALATDGLSPADVRRVIVHVPPGVAENHADVGWSTPGEAQMSLPYLVSVVLHDASCGLRQFSVERIADSSVTAFAAERVTVVADPELSGTAARVIAELSGGATRVDQREVPKGSPQDPLSRSEVESKFRDVSADVLPGASVEAAAKGFATLEDAHDIRELIAILADRR